jgi:DNA-directed RNA polymerase subunit RPC12/RpoP
MAKTIKCNQCGAADLIKIEEYEYKCRYCHSRIVIEKPKFDLGNFAKTFDTKHLYNPTQTTFTPTGEVIKKASRLGCLVIAIIFLGIISGVIIPIIVSINRSSNSVETTADGWAVSYTPYVFYANGSKGGVVWKFTEENYDWKKNRSVLTILDPKTNKELKREIVIAEHQSSETVPSLWDLYNGGKIFGDTIFFTPKKGGLVGKNIYTGKTVIDNNYIQKQIGNEVAEARAYANNKDNYVNIKDAEGTEYYYFPKRNKIITQDEYRSTKNIKKINKFYYVLSGRSDKKHVLRILQEINELETPTSYNSVLYSDFKKEKSYYQKYYQLKSLDSIPVNHGFFNAEIIHYNDSSFILKYTKNLLEGSPITFAKYGLDGKQIWSVIPSQLSVFKIDEKNTVRTTVNYEFNVLGNALVIYFNSTQKAAAAINVVDGKTIWTFQCLK